LVCCRGDRSDNWEREPGERVEEFDAALLLLEHPAGNLITPIYQVKRYTGRVTSRQAADIEQSWSTFVRETLPVLPVRSWTLVTPWNPTNERRTDRGQRRSDEVDGADQP